MILAGFDCTWKAAGAHDRNDWLSIRWTTGTALNQVNREKVRRRLPRREREKLIVAEAVRFFAEVGLEGQTRALAQRLGVTQPLLYRYFPDKEALIERVYEEAFLNDWNPAWENVLAADSRPLTERVVEFYGHYVGMAFNYERVRLAMFVGLRDCGMARRYAAFTNDHLLMPLARAIRAETGMAGEPGPAELALAGGLHGAVVFIGVRRWVYGIETPEDLAAEVRAIIEAFVAGAPAAVARINGLPKAPPLAATG